MKQKIAPIKVFNFSNPLMATEVLSVLGDKFAASLPFEWELSKDYASSEIVLWDGIITPKNQKIVDKILDDIKSGKVLLLLGESQTLHKERQGVKILNTENLNVVELSSWSVLPEEILGALEDCYKKLKHV
jgi:hypothetical protein